MKMIRFDDLALFVRTAALGSFSNAAREADLLPGQVSAAIQRLERELDIRLFARSTRSLRLTAQGEEYLPYAKQVLAALQEGRERLRGDADALQGLLQISAVASEAVGAAFSVRSTDRHVSRSSGDRHPLRACR
jgi:DNA-binding transcriptional LysR family regulator